MGQGQILLSYVSMGAFGDRWVIRHAGIPQDHHSRHHDQGRVSQGVKYVYIDTQLLRNNTRVSCFRSFYPQFGLFSQTKQDGSERFSGDVDLLGLAAALGYNKFEAYDRGTSSKITNYRVVTEVAKMFQVTALLLCCILQCFVRMSAVSKFGSSLCRAFVSGDGEFRVICGSLRSIPSYSRKRGAERE